MDCHPFQGGNRGSPPSRTLCTVEESQEELLPWSRTPVSMKGDETYYVVNILISITELRLSVRRYDDSRPVHEYTHSKSPTVLSF